MEEILRKLVAVYDAAGDDWYDVKHEIMDVLDLLLMIQGQKFCAVEMELMRDGDYIKAIKSYRDRTKMSLRGAKAAVDEWMSERQIPKQNY